MQSITRNVRDLTNDERKVYEAVLGEHLRENQRIVIQVVSDDEPAASDHDVDDGPFTGKLPEWCNVYEGLSDEEVAEVESIALRRSDLSRNS